MLGWRLQAGSVGTPLFVFLFRFDVGALHLLCAESFWFISQSFVSCFPNFSLFFCLFCVKSSLFGSWIFSPLLSRRCFSFFSRSFQSFCLFFSSQAHLEPFCLFLGVSDIFFFLSPPPPRFFIYVFVMSLKNKPAFYFAFPASVL